MPPRKDVTLPQTCAVCGETKDPGSFAKCNARKDANGNVVGFSLRSECKACAAAAKAAKAAASVAQVAGAGAGTKSSVDDMVRGTWTITEGKQAAPTPRKQKYVGSSELSPEFVDEQYAVLISTMCYEL
jgi:hypothetical protein